MLKSINNKLLNIIFFLVGFILFRNTVFKYLFMMFLIYELVTYYVHDLQNALLMTAILTLLLSVFKISVYTESFENNSEKKDASELIEVVQKSVSSMTDQDVSNPHSKAMTDKDTFTNEEEQKEATNTDEYIRSTQAQKETYRLINTIKQLEDTLNGLAPTIKQGAKIIEQFKRLNLVK